jgi:hypothetical protein
MFSSYRLLLLVLCGGLLRFYKLDWGEGYFFHPDERNIVSLAVSITPSSDLHFLTKGTFAYGSLIPYLAFGIDFLRRTFFSSLFSQDSFAFIMLLLRLTSAFFSTLTIFLSYCLGEKFWNKKVGFLAASLVAFSPGLIQSAHFATFEAVLSFLYLLVFFFNLRLFQKGHLKDFFLGLLFIAIASAIKINSLLFVPLLIFLLLLSQRRRQIAKKVLAVIFGLFFLSFLVISLSPYYLTQGFRNMLDYEQQLVRGKIDIFYTRQFIATQPITFPFLKILPLLINPLLVFLLPPLIVFYFFHLVKERLRENKNELILLCFWAALFFPNALLFTKWTRYMVPTIPFLIFFVVVFIEKFVKQWQQSIFFGLALTSVLWGLAFMAIYYHRDTRLTASEWIHQNCQDNAYFLSETANVLDIPMPTKGKIPTKNFIVENFDFYHLEENEGLLNELLSNLEKADYILIPSRRLFGGMGRLPQKYPLVNRYYQLLFSEKLGFKAIKKFTSYPRLWFFEFPDEFAEETWSVFDHPVIRVYQKDQFYDKEKYLDLLMTSSG